MSRDYGVTAPGRSSSGGQVFSKGAILSQTSLDAPMRLRAGTKDGGSGRGSYRDVLVETEKGTDRAVSEPNEDDRFDIRSRILN
ncbi:MAG: hypothetical protein MUO52_00840 [Desulfobacterales bacterium]|nr:hypothetical protein [Desulfobacterales bacterium]